MSQPSSRRKRYVWSLLSEHYHDRTNLHEECNTDSLLRRRSGDEPPEDKQPCQHCIGENEGMGPR